MYLDDNISNSFKNKLESELSFKYIIKCTIKKLLLASPEH